MKCRQSFNGLGKLSWACLLALLLTATLVHAQLEAGDDMKMTLNGFLGMGYSGNYGDSGVSGHGLFASGTAQLSGYYYSPNFLSFNVRPFYNRNQDNGSFGSVLSDTGLEMSTNLFAGSHFPGSVSFSKAYTEGSQYGLPGSIGLSSNSATDNFAVSWSELLPGLPSLTATFSRNGSSSTIQGVTGTTDSSSRNFSLLSNYKIDGWGFNGFWNHQNFGATLPSFLSPTNASTDSSATSYGASANHALPWSGTFEAGYSRTDYGSESDFYRNSGSTSTADSVVSFRPIEQFTINGQIRYTGNLIGALQQSLSPNSPPLPSTDQSSHGLSLSSYGSYNIGHGFILIGYVTRQMATFQGIETDSTRVGGTLTYSYSRPLFGLLYFSFGMVNNASNNNGGGSIGYVGNVSLKKKLGLWQVDSDFSYAQNVQTIVSFYTSSTYSYGMLARRRFGANGQWNASYRGIQSGLTQLPGYSNRSDTFLTNFTHGRYGLSGSYSISHGTALLSTTGVLNPTPLAALLAPDQAIYDGKVYGGGVSVTPLKKMIVNVNWYRANTDTQTAQIFSGNNSDRLYAQMQYNLRKLSFRAGYWKVNQSIGAAGLPPSSSNTYYFNISRWFDIF